MKKFLFGCVIAAGGLTMPSAFAQDYCCPTQFDPCCCDNVTDFNGLYIGGNVGVINHLSHRNDLDGFLTDNSGWSTNDINVTAGVQIGYDWQCCYQLFGIVADWNWTNAEKKIRDDQNDPDDPGDNNYVNSKFEWFTTIRARAGLAVCDTLIYLTGGAVVGSFDTTWFDAPDKFHHCNTRWGWTGGFGAEFLAWCNFSVSAEFLFLHFNDHTRSFTSTAGNTFAFSHSDSAWVGRILVNYRFGDLCSCLGW